VNWDNQNKDPWGGKNDAPDFDELVKKFSSILGGKKSSSGLEEVLEEVRVVVLRYQLQEYFYTHFLVS